MHTQPAHRCSAMQCSSAWHTTGALLAVPALSFNKCASRPGRWSWPNTYCSADCRLPLLAGLAAALLTLCWVLPPLPLDLPVA